MKTKEPTPPAPKHFCLAQYVRLPGITKTDLKPAIRLCGQLQVTMLTPCKKRGFQFLFFNQ